MPKAIARETRLKEVVAAVQAAGGNIAEAARSMKKGRSAVSAAYNEAVSLGMVAQCPKSQRPSEEKYERSGDDELQTLHSVSRRIKSVDDALEYFKVDSAIWEVERFTVNQWEMGSKIGEKGDEEIVVTPLHQVKVFLRRKVGKHIEFATSELIKRIKDKSPKKWPKIGSPKKSSGLMLEISLFDVHFGKLCWAPETGTPYDLKIASSVYKNAVEDLLVANSHNKIDQILFPLGEDFFHVDGASNATTGGTQMDVTGRWPEVFNVGVKAVLNAAQLASSVAPVKFMWVPGNHDYWSSYYLCQVVGAYFHANKHITVDVSAMPRKYELWGDVLLGFTHGDKEKPNELPLIMAGEHPDWSKSKFREIHVGHFHKKKEMQYNAGDTFGPVYVRTLPSMSGTDAWHFLNGYVKSIRAAQAFLWDKANGLLAMHERPARMSA